MKPMKMKDGSYLIAEGRSYDCYAHKAGREWVVVESWPGQFKVSDPEGGFATFGTEAKAVSWAKRYSYLYRTLQEAQEANE